MSYSFRIPEEDPICECRWDEARQRMDREDCAFHANLPDDPEDVDGMEDRPAELPVTELRETSIDNFEKRSDDDEIRSERKPAQVFDRPAKAS